MSRQARALGLSIALHGAAVLAVLGLRGGGSAPNARVIDLRLLESGTASAAATPAPAPAVSRRPPARAPAPAAPAASVVRSTPPPSLPPPAPAPVETAAPLTPVGLPEAAPAPAALSEEPDQAPVSTAGAVGSPVFEPVGPEASAVGPPAPRGAAATAAGSTSAAVDSAAGADGAAPPEIAAVPREAPAGEAPGAVARDLAALREIVQRLLVYPSLARRMGWEGKVTLSFVVCSDGRARDVVILQSSGRDLLDRHAVEAVQRIAGLPASTVEARVIVPVVYRLH